MRLRERIALYYQYARSNKWFYLFAAFCRVMLALGFLISGIVKIKGERFAEGLPVNNPMGHYLEALFHTQFYYTFIGIGQLLIAILLLIPRTALLGAILYFPVILNITILAHALRFEGTRITSFMLLANLFLLCWDYQRLKYILPGHYRNEDSYQAKRRSLSKKFPFGFAAMLLGIMAAIIVGNMFLYAIRPGNSAEECINGCPGNTDPVACEEFCDCIYNKGNTLKDCLGRYEAARANREKGQ